MGRVLNSEELEKHGKPPGSTWYMEEETRNYDGKDVIVKTISPYKIPWNSLSKAQGGDGPRPQDYYDNLEREIYFSEGEHDISIFIHGKSRNERMLVYVDRVQMNFHGQEQILNMGATFQRDDMFLLEQIVGSDSLLNYSLHAGSKNTFVAPYMNIYSERTSKLSAQEFISKSIRRYLQYLVNFGTEKRVIIPIVTSSNPRSQGHHWYCCVLELDKDNKPNITFIDSTNKMKVQKFEEILEEYYNHIVIPINNALQAEGMQTVAADSIEYCQGLQYGEMGCGVTTSINIKKLLEGADFAKYTFLDQELEHKTGITLAYEQNGEFIIKDGLTFDEVRELKDANKENITIFDEQEVNTTELKRLKHDKSERGDLIQEALQRYKLAKEVKRREYIASKVIPGGFKRAQLDFMRSIRQSPFFQDRVTSARIEESKSNQKLQKPS